MVEKEKIKCVVFDLDGTIYIGDRLVEAANEVIDYARKKYGRIGFATNNSALKREQIYDRLVKMGVEGIHVNDVVNSSYLISRYLINNSYRNVWCIGTDNLKEELEQHGIDPISKSPQAFVIGYNPNFELQEIEEALKAYKDDCRIIVANMEKVYPRKGGILSPGCGAIVAAFCHTVDRDVDEIIGKPSRTMLTTLAHDKGVRVEEVLMVGDSITSDYQMAKQCGAQAIWISTRQVNSLCEDRVASLAEILRFI